MDLKERAKQLRILTLDLAIESNNGHIASAFSMIEILVALYYEVMGSRDKFILSKGHGCLSLYAILRQKGFNPKISGHPDIEPEQGIECTTGSLGHGLPIGIGMALARKMKGIKGDIYVLMGDGECQEGTTWESLLLCNKFHLDNLIIIVDRNHLQALDDTEETLPLGDLWTKMHVFNACVSVLDGHSFDWLIPGLKKRVEDKTSIVVAHTVKGKGSTFMEGIPMWHNKLPEEKLLKQAYRELL